MSDTQQKHSVSREKLQRLMARVQQTSPPPAPKEVAEFDWLRPHRFGCEAQSAIEGLGKRLALAVQKTLGDQVSPSVEAALKDIREHCANRIARELSKGMEGSYIVGLRDQAKQCVGCLVFSYETACFLVAQMLNDPEAAVGQDGRFSALEESILIDIAAILTDPLDDVLTEQIKLTVSNAEHPVRGDWVMRAKYLEDLCELSFTLKFGEQDISFSMILESEFLDQYAGLPVKRQQTAEPDSIRILQRLRKAPVSVNAVISTNLMQFGDLAQLEAGDVVALGKKTKKPLDILLNGRACFQGYPAVVKEKIAMIIAESANEYE